MESSSRSSNYAAPTVMISRKKCCNCGSFAHLLTSRTQRNPGRRFWKCANWNISTLAIHSLPHGGHEFVSSSSHPCPHSLPHSFL
ncbi:hypothetical protein RIF29_03389 [Crotalaria pallida]|uniref:GRF-type domain-containing protein n=1 Tax=Crotalaria pallida TaxID=3830 RepID=A0AAN9IZW8_CROPI